MRTRNKLIGLAAAALLPAGFTALPASAAPATKCGTVITASITLQANVGPCSGDGLIVRGTGITVNLGGHTVTGKKTSAETAGVFLDGSTGVTLRNGTVTGFDAGVLVQGGSSNTVTGIYAHDNINDNTGSQTTSHGCGLGDGITVDGSDGNTITSNTVVHNGPYSGISLLTDADNNTVKGNTVENNNVPNFRPNGVGNCGAPFSRPIQDIGIRVEGPGADNNLVQSNRVVNSAIGGITIHGYVYCPPTATTGVCGTPQDQNTGNRIEFNYVADTGHDTYTQDSLADGIGVLRQGPASVVGVSQGNTISSNTVVNSYRHGVYVGNPTQPGPKVGNSVVGNTVQYSLFDGIDVPSGSVNNTIDSNTAQYNGRVDGYDGNTNCDNNLWTNNVLDYVNQACVSASAVIKP